MPFRIPVDQPRLDSRCLGFFVLDKAVAHNQDAANGGGLGRAALTYSLEAGVLSARHPIGGDRFTVALRDNTRLAQWEPMTEEKLGLLAVELGVWDSGGGLPAAVSEPAISTVVVSPEGFVIHWDEFDQIAVSDVLRLARYPDATIARPRSTDAWSMYRLDENDAVYKGPGLAGRADDIAHLGNGHYPKPVSSGKEPDSLAEYAGRVISFIHESDNDPYAQFHPAAAEFVRHHFGVDVTALDWREANKHRIINTSFSRNAPFDAAAACATLRLAALSARANAAIPGPSCSRTLASLTPARTAKQPKPGT